MKILTGNSNRPLAEAISAYLNLPLVNASIRRFSDIVFEAGISAPVRTPRGRDIDAACGQLRTAAEKKSRAERDREALGEA